MFVTIIDLNITFIFFKFKKLFSSLTKNLGLKSAFYISGRFLLVEIKLC